MWITLTILPVTVCVSVCLCFCENVCGLIARPISMCECKSVHSMLSPCLRDLKQMHTQTLHRLPSLSPQHTRDDTQPLPKHICKPAVSSPLNVHHIKTDRQMRHTHTLTPQTHTQMFVSLTGSCHCGSCMCHNPDGKSLVTGRFCECDDSECLDEDTGEVCGGTPLSLCVVYV